MQPAWHIIYYAETLERLYRIRVKEVTMADSAAILQERWRLRDQIYKSGMTMPTLDDLDIEAIATGTFGADHAADAQFYKLQNYPFLKFATASAESTNAPPLEDGYTDENMPTEGWQPLVITPDTFDQLPEALVAHWLFAVLTYNPQYTGELAALKVFLLKSAQALNNGDLSNCWLNKKISSYVSAAVSSRSPNKS